ncbi:MULTISPECIES: helix-turn-helix domain-containing protein [Paraburkholderia]|uniref:Transcriptional regulator n=1 Tax=Paraburkholderia tropica TaxID=92647 RepID=A0A1A5XJP7_9BURK|nr:helix-turn-helix domain-containing protein [Paraburkholderia tropica]MBB2979870.1 DNA-binding XRE family transcriptional regulator [Paraburkholderia tropica]MBB3000530.1 DNA-binding XRE family transcriptional regulator [Paraburkholderia tropica]MBB6320159.1 DNA-binding XRE family transcriptional regulator [Paraburkholderia tropica]MDE1143655.1 helix-turn-helix domain-containing protein [Paraburkholderia tropica]OBR53333.1 transcriptional regulator [Paraburkholderia tropica]
MPRRNPLSREEQNAQRREFYERIERGELSIADAMKAMRKMTGLTQAEFAAHRGVSRRVIQDIERGTGNPTVESLNSIGKLFGLQVGFVRRRRGEAAGGASE